MSSQVDYNWKTPRCLLENTSGRMLKVNEETLTLLQQIHDPVVVVAIVGLYRTGKSYLMNKLAGKQSGFNLGNTIQAMTKGIWIWCISHPFKPDTCLALIDTEGLGDVEKGDSKNDVQLFTLAALLSSTLVYNSKGVIDQKAMDDIHYVTEIAEKLSISEKSNSQEDGDIQLAEYFPKFVWAVRDFTLALESNGNPLTPDEYLENCLNLKKGASAAVTMYNLPRRCIRRYFPERKCFVFPPPVGNPEQMLHLEGLSEDQLLPAFNQSTKEFYDYIQKNSCPKAVGGHILNGPKFAGVVKQYVDQISEGKIPSIETAVVSMARQVNKDALSECEKQYKAAMSSFKLPYEDDRHLNLHHQQCEATVRILFFKLAMIIEDESKLSSEFTDMITKGYKEICARNDELSMQTSKQILDKLQEFIQARLDSGFYFKVGGYTEYQQDIAELVKKYLATPGKGIQSIAVLDQMLQKQIGTAKSIMAVDKNMTEVQQKAEEQRLEHEQLKKQVSELEKANRRAERQHEEQTRLQKEFMNSMQSKFNQELEVYKKQLNQLKQQLEKERQRLQREDARDDADEITHYFRTLQPRQQSHPSSFFGVRHLFR